jgi:hypothetical protein
MSTRCGAKYFFRQPARRRSYACRNRTSGTRDAGVMESNARRRAIIIADGAHQCANALLGQRVLGRGLVTRQGGRDAAPVARASTSIYLGRITGGGPQLEIPLQLGHLVNELIEVLSLHPRVHWPQACADVRADFCEACWRTFHTRRCGGRLAHQQSGPRRERGIALRAEVAECHRVQDHVALGGREVREEWPRPARKLRSDNGNASNRTHQGVVVRH